MVEIVWEFRVKTGREREFEEHSGPEGTWAVLFRKDSAYLGISLSRDREVVGRYLTVDRWEGIGDFERFKVKHGAEYAEVDARMEELTESEMKLGVFESVR